MSSLAPYSTGLWLAEYINIRCQLCHVYRSEPQSQLVPYLPSEVSGASDSSSNIQANSHPKSPSSQQHSDSKLARAFNKWIPNSLLQSSWLQSSLLCPQCHNSIAWLPAAFRVDIAAGVTLPIQAATYYEYPLRPAIRAFKHSEDMTKLPLLVHALRQLPRPHGCHAHNSVIVAMPTTPDRLIRRGFDPVTILSIQLSKHWQIPLWDGVARIDDTLSQQGLTRAERLANLHDAFAVTEVPRVKRFLLFDDVATTGASLQALAQALFSYTNPSSIDHKDSLNNISHSHISAYALAHGNQ